MEFRLSSPEELAEAIRMVKRSEEVRDAVQIASGAATYRAMADETRNVLVILPS